MLRHRDRCWGLCAGRGVLVVVLVVLLVLLVLVLLVLVVLVVLMVVVPVMVVLVVVFLVLVVLVSVLLMVVVMMVVVVLVLVVVLMVLVAVLVVLVAVLVVLVAVLVVMLKPQHVPAKHSRDQPQFHSLAKATTPQADTTLELREAHLCPHLKAGGLQPAPPFPLPDQDSPRRHPEQGCTSHPKPLPVLRWPSARRQQAGMLQHHGTSHREQGAAWSQRGCMAPRGSVPPQGGLRPGISPSSHPQSHTRLVRVSPRK